MDPNSGRILSDEDLGILRKRDPDEAAKFSVRLEGTEADIRQISEAVKDARRRANKAARKARRKNRS